ncbi:MAG: DUF72 domain-containing protein [Myxococcales bacterium]|jgi:hypothetical protein|nr:DUF72 domain-containing protein [Myxococcales bacterium]
MKLHIGQSALQGGIRRYPFDLLELLVAPNLPQPKKLALWVDAMPSRVFSLRLPPEVVRPGSAQEEIVERALRARDALGARWGVLTTSPTTTPTARNRALLTALTERLRSPDWRLAWEPHGVWAPEEAEGWAEELDLTLVRDLSRDDAPETSVVYTRLRALGFGTRVGARAIERLAERLEGVEEAYVVIEGEGAVRAAASLRELLGGEADA